MPHHAAREFQRLVALIFFGKRLSAIEIFPREVGRGGFPEFGNELLGVFKTSLTLLMVADIGGL